MIVYRYNFGDIALNVLPKQQNNKVQEGRFEAFTRALDVLTDFEAQEEQKRVEYDFPIIKKAFKNLT